ncbi:aminotransferase class V-fold PLP-dependent enzyme [Actinospica robiniae]|uniref:aminotransferase class V-fold PLP-dependent enzyme n=1 Tax=Actinospica robiniae TaxID=304901 RepID=UPI0004108C67|nr:aminotransferase class V-fold PLP-dependent enzyme [Actinospica robiniae]
MDQTISAAAAEDPLYLPDQWALDPKVTYLNHGAFGSVPRPALAERRRWQDQIDANPMGFYRRVMDGAIDRSRLATARFLGADDEGVGLCLNATTGVGAVLGSFKLAPGDRILTTDHIYGPVLWAAQVAAQRAGAEVDVAKVSLDGDDEETVSAVLAEVTGDTRLAIIDHISSSTAKLFPVERLVQALKERGVKVLVDAAHAPGAVDVNLEELGADYWTGNLHKWACAPRGTAAIYAAKELRDGLESVPISWRRPQGFPHSFSKIATADVTGWLAAPASLKFFEDLGWEAVRRRNNALAHAGQHLIAAEIGVSASLESMPDRGEENGYPIPMRLLPLPGVTATREAAVAFTDRLAIEYAIECPVDAWNGQTLLRISAQLYNAIADYERLAAVLKETLAR